jgi:hypothetical protein
MFMVFLHKTEYKFDVLHLHDIICPNESVGISGQCSGNPAALKDFQKVSTLQIKEAMFMQRIGYSASWINQIYPVCVGQVPRDVESGTLLQCGHRAITCWAKKLACKNFGDNSIRRSMNNLVQNNAHFGMLITDTQVDGSTVCFRKMFSLP